MKTLLRACVVLACALLLAGCQQELYMDLTESSANEMIAALANAGISASKSASETLPTAAMIYLVVP